MIVEILYKEFVIYGEKGTIQYLQLLFPEADFVFTSYEDQPAFSKEKVDFIFLGPMAENNLDKIVTKLQVYKEELVQAIETGTVFLAINNAIDILGKKLEVKNGPPGQTLGIFPYVTIRNYDERFSEISLYDFQGDLIHASRMGFSQYFFEGNIEDHESWTYLYKALYPERGMNAESPFGGLRYKNVILIDLAGSIFLSNPQLTRKLKALLSEDLTIPLEEEMQYSYDFHMKRLKTDPAYNRVIESFYKQIKD